MKNDEIEDLQARIAFQEDLLNSLNTRIADQGKEIVVLQKQLQHIYNKMSALETASGHSEDDNIPPPHY